MRAGLISLDVHLPGVRSLKEKRRIVRSVVDRLRREVNCAVAEVAHQQLWQRCGLGVAVVSEHDGGVRALAEHVRRCVEREPRLEVVAFDLDVVAAEDR